MLTGDSFAINVNGCLFLCWPCEKLATCPGCMAAGLDSSLTHNPELDKQKKTDGCMDG